MTPVFAVIDAPIIAIIVGLAVLLFGADRIPKLARSMGEAKKEFENASKPPSPSAGDAPAPQDKPNQSPPAPQA